MALLPRAHVCPEWNLWGPQHHHLLHHHQQQQVWVVTIKDTTIILTTTRPTISNSGSSTSSSTNQNTDSDTIINTPMNTNTNTAGRRRRRSTRDKETPERFVQFIRESLPDSFAIIPWIVINVMIFVFFFPSDFPRRHVGLKLFDSLSICFTVDLRWMVGKPAIALQQQDFHSILQWQPLTSQHRASCNTRCHPKRRGWLTIREQKCF